MQAESVVPVSLCGLPCGELRLEFTAASGPRLLGGCPLCRGLLPPAGFDNTVPLLNGRPASFEAALARAAELVLEARSPFVYGLSRSSGGTARLASAVARRIGGAIDIESGGGLEPEHAALRVFGRASATFGEIRERSDVVLLWRCDPRRDHPGLLPPRMATRGGRAERIFILVPPDGHAGGGSGSGDTLELGARPGSDLEILTTLKALASGREPRGNGVGGVPMADLHRAASALRQARYAALLWDAAGHARPEGVAIASALLLLARDLNVGGRAAACPLGAGGNVAGAMAALLAECGAPRAIGFQNSVPLAAPEMFGSEAMADGGADLLLLVGALALPRSPASREAKAHPPGGSSPPAPAVVAIGAALPEGCQAPEVFIPASVPALSGRGLWVRADGVPLPLRPVLPTPHPAEEVILGLLIEVLGPGGAASDAVKVRP